MTAKWPEVRNINDYVALLGGLSMVIRGLDFLVVTWTTVVLLGGFVSVLQKKDFWSLTVITFIELAGVVDDLGGDRWGSFAATIAGMVVIVRTHQTHLTSTTPPGNISRVAVFGKFLLLWIPFWVQAGPYVVVYICSFFGIFVWGVYIATGVSLWRLIQHDYGNADEDSSKSNMNPALDVLYIIVVVQGAIFVYRRILHMLLKSVVSQVAEVYGFKGPSVASVHGYMIETKRGCAKNLSFAKGRNLVTYALDLMGPDKSPQDCLSGLKILSTILGPLDQGKSKKFKEQCLLIRQLILYAPSNHIFRRLLVLSNPRSCFGGTDRSTQMRKHAASILVQLADEVSVEQIPQVIQCMSSLMGTFEDSEHYPEEEGYLERLWECLHVLFVFAADENNCRLIIHTPGLLTKIMMPLTSDRYHQTDHETWGDVLVESLEVINRLTASHGHGEILLREISTNQEVFESINRILGCDGCEDEDEKTLIMGILTNLHMKMLLPNKVNFIEMLADIYTYNATGSTSLPGPTRIAALEAMAKLCSQDESTSSIILQVNGSAVYSFTGDLDT